MTRGTGPPEPAGGCTADNPPARLDVSELLADDDLADFRQRTGLAGASPEDAEILADPEDPSTCARLQQLVPKDYRTKGEQRIWRFTYWIRRCNLHTRPEVTVENELPARDVARSRAAETGRLRISTYASRWARESHHSHLLTGR